jgi:hypothetical protein
MGILFWMVVDPTTLPDTSGLPSERAQDLCVGDRRSWTSEQVVADYESVSSKAMASLGDLVGQAFEVPLGDLGTYPASVLPSAFSFDHFVHIRADLFSPRGPLTAEPPPSDTARLVPALDWIEAALPQQNSEKVGALDGVVEIELDGPGARSIRIGTGDVATSLRSDTSSFVRWISQRATWEDAGVEVSGDGHDLDIARTLRVF